MPDLSIRWMGHACFLIETGDGKRIITDPFDESVGYPVPAVEADVVTSSHSHFDHGNVGVVKGNPTILKGPGYHLIGGISILGVKTYHDEERGAKRGENTVFVIRTDGLSICHLGDLGSIPSEDALDEIGQVDILMVPVGGTYTLDARGANTIVDLIKPKVVIPMHYKTPVINFPISDLTPFLEGKADVVYCHDLVYGVASHTLPERVQTVVMRYE